MAYLVLYILLAALCIPNLRFAPANMDIKTTMDRMNRLRFIFAIFIVFTHCTLPYEYLPHILLPLRKVSTFGVGYFFTLSGYGLAYSAAHKPDYLRGFWKKIANLVWLTAFSSVVSMLIKNIAFGGGEALRMINWYMPAMIALYLIFYVGYSIFPESKWMRNVFLVGAVLVIMGVICGIDNLTGLNHRNYYISELAFPFGVLLYEYSDVIAGFMKKKWAVLLIIAAEIVVGGAALVVPEKSLPYLLLHNLMLIPVELLMIWVLDKVEINNVILRTMSRYSLFVYLFQFPILEILKRWYITNERPFDVLWFLGCLGLTCVLAVALQTVYDFAGKALHKNLSSKH